MADVAMALKRVPIAHPVSELTPLPAWSPPCGHWVRTSEAASHLAKTVLLAERVLCGAHGPLFSVSQHSVQLTGLRDRFGMALHGLGLEGSVPHAHPRTASGFARPTIHDQVLMLAARLVDPPELILTHDHNELLLCVVYSCGIAEYGQMTSPADSLVTLGTLAYLGVPWQPLRHISVRDSLTISEFDFQNLIDAAARHTFARATWALNDRTHNSAETRELRAADAAIAKNAVRCGIMPWQPVGNLNPDQQRMLRACTSLVSAATLYAFEEHPFQE